MQLVSKPTMFGETIIEADLPLHVCFFKDEVAALNQDGQIVTVFVSEGYGSMTIVNENNPQYKETLERILKAENKISVYEFLEVVGKIQTKFFASSISNTKAPE